MVMFIFKIESNQSKKRPNMDMSIFGLFRLRQYKKCTHKCLWVHFICSDFWYFLELSSKRHRLKPFEFSPHGLTDRFRLNCEPSSPMNAFSHILCSWARNRRNGVRFLKRPQNVSRSFRRSSPTFHFWTRLAVVYWLSFHHSWFKKV